MNAHPRQHLLTCVARLRRALDEIQPQIVHVHSFFGVLSGSLATIGRNAPSMVASLRNLGYEAWPANTLYRKFRKRVHGYLLRRTDYVAAVSRAVAEHYLSHLRVGTDRIIPDSLPLAVNEIATAPHAERRTASIRVALPGRIVREKGHRSALVAVHSLIRDGMNIRLDILGGGPLESSVKAQSADLGIAEFVTFNGVMDHRALLTRLSQADICIIPSLHEGFGIVALEAMALGIPVISSKVGGLSEIVEHGTTGLQVSPGNPAELARAIERLANDPEMMSRLTNAAFKSVKRQYSMDAIAPVWLNVYEQLTYQR